MRPHILLLTTGGTIASLPTAEGLAPGLDGEALAGLLPQGIMDCYDITIRDILHLDSSNIQPEEWVIISRAIFEARDSYDGIVVSHGTDTMAYTAAALSYLIQGSPKPIVLTGSQQPMANPFTDAKLNLYQSLLYATDDDSHDVSIVFGGSVIVGTRAHKQRTMSFNAFTSVNYPLPAIIRNDRIVREGREGMTIPGAMGWGFRAAGGTAARLRALGRARGCGAPHPGAWGQASSTRWGPTTTP